MRSRVSLLSRCVATVGDDRNQWAAVNPTRGGSGGEGAPTTVMLWETPWHPHGANARADLSTGLPLLPQRSPLRPTR
jgi:hypothetical protein